MKGVWLDENRILIVPKTKLERSFKPMPKKFNHPKFSQKLVFLLDFHQNSNSYGRPKDVRD